VTWIRRIIVAYMDDGSVKQFSITARSNSRGTVVVNLSRRT